MEVDYIGLNLKIIWMNCEHFTLIEITNQLKWYLVPEKLETSTLYYNIILRLTLLASAQKVHLPFV
jgi:hypothetical protein